MVNFGVATRSLLHGPHRVGPCEVCAVRDVAACGALNTDERRHLTAIMTVLELTPQRLIFGEGDQANYVFTVTEGVIKIYKTLPDGRRQITGFLFAGDFLGLVDTHSYAYSAETLTISKLCRFPRQKLEALLHALPRLEHRLLGMASHEIAAGQDQIVLLGRKSARERVASFLMLLLNAAARHDEQDNVVPLPMSRTDIGDYLGLTPETVSRTFRDLRTRRLIEMLDGRHVRVLNAAALNRAATEG
jgi:CRP/FNR family transcriptional regulator